MGNTIVVTDDNNNGIPDVLENPVDVVTDATSNESDVASEVVDTVQDDVVPDVVEQLSDVIEVESSNAAAEAVDAHVQEVVAEATEVTHAQHFESIFQRLDAIESELVNLRETPRDAVVVVDDGAPTEVVDTVTGEVVDVSNDGSDAGVPGTDVGADDRPDVKENFDPEPDRTPNRKLGWRAVILGGSGGTGARRR